MWKEKLYSILYNNTGVYCMKNCWVYTLKSTTKEENFAFRQSIWMIKDFCKMLMISIILEMEKDWLYMYKCIVDVVSKVGAVLGKRN